MGTLVTAVSTALTSTTRSQEPTGFLNRTIEVEGVSHRYQVYVPADYSRARRWPVILFLHGSGERGAEPPGVGHESWVEAFESAELPRWLLARSRSGRAGPARDG
jgi:poly(3-hydroxybutyrate) depolymerase